jgi:hypothetical protein
MRHAKLVLALFVLLAVNFLAAQKLQEGASGALHNAPDGKGGQGQEVLAAAPSGGSVVQGNGIVFHTGGTVLKSAVVPVYIIWYGNWSNGTHASDSQTTVNLIDAFFASSGGIGGSGYERINTLYGDLLGNVSGNLALSSQIFDSYSQTARLSDAKLQSVVSSHLTNGSLPTDPNGVYVVLTSSDVSESSGFCTRYCGFHTHATLNGADIKYAFVGNVDRCPSGCEIQTTSPNGDSGADGMANTLAHETEETITDPDLNAWFDSSGNEDADKCNFKFGPTQVASNGSKFNQTFGTHHWMIQMEWENSRGGGCDQTLGGAFFTN